jgi:predicted PurR-regulated permease PerM
MFYLLRDWNSIIGRIDILIPRRQHARAGEAAREIDAVLAEFLRGQLAVIVAMSAYYTIALWAVGLEFALPVGLITGILVFVPYIGILIGLLLATLAALTQFPAFMDALPVWIVFAAGQAIEGMVVTPRLVGRRIGLHPLAVIFALLAFGQIFGFFGVLLALPVSAVLLVGMRRLHQRYLDSPSYKS